MPFRFPMQRILDYREQLEEEARIRFAQAQSRVLEAEKSVAEVEAEITAFEEESRAHPPMNSSEFWIADQYLRGLQEDLQARTMQLKMACTLRDEAQKMLTERAMEKKMLEKLKERQQKSWRSEELRKEQNFNDEIATIRYKKAPAC